MAGESPAAVFHRMGLRVRGAWPFPRTAPRAIAAPAANRFRDALEELGGLYATFGHYLTFRADLVRPDYLAALRQIRCVIPPLPRQEAVRIIGQDLGAKGDRLSAAMEAEPLWSTVGRCAWKTTWEERPVIVQVARPPVSRVEWELFAKGIRKLNEPGLSMALAPQVLLHYRDWLRITDSPQRERSYLATLATAPSRPVIEYPKLIPEISRADVTCWLWVEGEPLDGRLARGEDGVAGKLAEALLEQVCLFGVVDADWDPSAMVVKRDGGLALRRANRLISIPPAMNRTVLKYVTAVLAGNSNYANRQLVRMVRGFADAQLEAQLYDALSNLEPELKINLRFPPSAGTFESNWRALARVFAERPAFVDAIHRNFVQVGYHDAEAAAPGETRDAIADAHWPVLGRLLRSRLGEFTQIDVQQQWVMGTGLLMLESMRQVTRQVEGFRDNDLAFVFTPAVSEDGSRETNRAIRRGAVLGILLLVFLVCLRWGAHAPAPWGALATALAVISAAGVLWTLSRMG